jgi:hypothetical protein
MAMPAYFVQAPAAGGRQDMRLSYAIKYVAFLDSEGAETTLSG